jgi:hypothetical protein
VAFIPSSRYAGVATTEVGGLTALKRRALPETAGDLHVVGPGERLDTIAEEQLEDATLFWRIADANSELYAPDLTAVPGRTIRVPRP